MDPTTGEDLAVDDDLTVDDDASSDPSERDDTYSVPVSAQTWLKYIPIRRSSPPPLTERRHAPRAPSESSESIVVTHPNPDAWVLTSNAPAIQNRPMVKADRYTWIDGPNTPTHRVLVESYLKNPAVDFADGSNEVKYVRILEDPLCVYIGISEHHLVSRLDHEKAMRHGHIYDERGNKHPFFGRQIVELRTADTEEEHTRLRRYRKDEDGKMTTRQPRENDLLLADYVYGVEDAAAPSTQPGTMLVEQPLYHYNNGRWELTTRRLCIRVENERFCSGEDLMLQLLKGAWVEMDGSRAACHGHKVTFPEILQPQDVIRSGGEVLQY